jgi:hypothetical protein
MTAARHNIVSLRGRPCGASLGIQKIVWVRIVLET